MKKKEMLLQGGWDHLEQQIEIKIEGIQIDPKEFNAILANAPLVNIKDAKPGVIK